MKNAQALRYSMPSKPIAPHARPLSLRALLRSRASEAVVADGLVHHSLGIDGIERPGLFKTPHPSSLRGSSYAKASSGPGVQPTGDAEQSAAGAAIPRT